MLRKIFDTDNKVFRFFAKLGYIWWLHILWLICSIPVISIGASTTALCYACMKLQEGNEKVTSNFFKSFKENFRQSTIIFIIYLIAGAAIVMDIIVCSFYGGAFSQVTKYAAIALMIPYIISAIYVFAIQAKFVNLVKKTIYYSFIVARKYIGATLMLVLILAASIALNMTIVLANFITVSMGIGIEVYLFSIIYNKIFRKIIAQVPKVQE